MKYATLTEITKSLESGSRPKGGVDSYSNGIPSLGGEHLDMEGGFRLDKIKWVPEEFYESMDKGKVNLDDILIVKDGATTGKTSFVSNRFPFQKACINEHVFRLEVNPDRAFPKFVFYFLNSPEGQRGILKDFRGATVGGISRSFSDGIEIPLPPLPEQKRIADILDKADAIRRKRKMAISSLKEIRVSQFENWFSPWFQPEAKKDHVPISEFVKRFEGGLNVATPESPSPDTRYYILKVSAVTSGDYRPEECKPLPTDFMPPYEHIVRNGDLLFSRANTTELVGATAFVFDTPSDFVLPDKLWRFVWKNPEKVEPLFVWALFNHPQIRVEIGRRATGTSGSMKNISMEKVMTINVPWPDIETQSRFARFIIEQRRLHHRMKASEHEADDLFNQLVQGFFM